MPKLSEAIDTINKFIITIAVVVGGAWTIYRYVSLEGDTAQLRITQLKDQCSQRGSLDFSFDIQNKNGVLAGSVKAHNVGTREVILYLEDNPAPIKFALLNPVQLGNPMAASIVSTGVQKIVDGGELKRVTNASILPGRTYDLPFAITTPGYGPILVSFFGGHRDFLSDDPQCTKTLPENPIERAKFENLYSWTADTIFFVDQPISDKK